MHSSSVEARFWAKVDRQETDGCWEWIGARVRDGYGIMYRARSAPRWYRSNRLSWELHNGPIPDGLHVLHRCDNPPCVNPAHLFLGTQADNNRDRDQKSRSGLLRGPGEGNGRAVLTWEKVREIRRRHEAGESQGSLAQEFGVQQPQISRIIRGDCWQE